MEPVLYAITLALLFTHQIDSYVVRAEYRRRLHLAET